MEKDLN